MGGTATSMRDPVFYRWHGHMEMIFARFKDKLPRYTEQQVLLFSPPFSPIIIQIFRIIEELPVVFSSKNKRQLMNSPQGFHQYLKYIILYIY